MFIINTSCNYTNSNNFADLKIAISIYLIAIDFTP